MNNFLYVYRNYYLKNRKANNLKSNQNEKIVQNESFRLAAGGGLPDGHGARLYAKHLYHLDVQIDFI